MSLFNQSVEITEFLYYNQPGKKKAKAKNTYRRRFLGSPDEALQNLYEHTKWENQVGFSFKPLVPLHKPSPNFGSLKSNLLVDSSYILALDIDIFDGLVGQPSSQGYLKFEEALPPGLFTPEKALTWARRVLLIPSAVGALVTYSHSTMAAKLGGPELPHGYMKMHIIFVMDKPLTDHEKKVGLLARCAKDQMYEGLHADGKLSIYHPWIDFNYGSAKMFNEWTGPESSIALYRPGVPLSSSAWVKTHKIKPLDASPIKVYSESQRQILLDDYADKRAAAAKKLGRPIKLIKEGDSLPYDHPLYREGKVMGMAGEIADKGLACPNFDALDGTYTKTASVYYVKGTRLFKDYHSDTSHTVDTKPLPITYIKRTGRYIADDFAKYHKPGEKKISLWKAQPDAGKTFAVLRINVGMFSPYSGGIVLVPTKALVQKIAEDYPHVTYMESGMVKWQSLPENVWGVMTYAKFIGHMLKGEHINNRLLVMDELHKMLEDSNPVTRAIRDIYQGKVDTGAKEILLVTATIDARTLMIPDLHTFQFDTTLHYDLVTTRVIPHAELRKAKRAFIFMDNKAQMGTYSSWFESMGRTSVLLHGQNTAIDHDELKYKTFIPNDLEEEFDFICSTSVLREGYSLTGRYDLVVVNNSVSNPQGVFGIAQTIMRTRDHEGGLFLKVAYTHFRKKKPQPDMNTYLMLAEKAMKPELLDKRLIDYFKADPLIQTAFRIEEIEATGEYIVMEDELGVIASYLKAKDAYELSNYEALQEGLGEYGIFVEDGHSMDNEYTEKELKEIESAERAEDNDAYKDLQAQFKAFKDIIARAESFDEVAQLLEEKTGLAAIEQLQKSIDNRNPLTETAWLNSPARTLTEKAQVGTKVSKGKKEDIRHHSEAVSNGVLARIGDYFEVGTVYSRKICTEKVNALVTGTSKYTITNVREALRTFCKFRMYTEDGELRAKYSSTVRFYELTQFGLVTEDMLVPLDKRIKLSPTLI